MKNLYGIIFVGFLSILLSGCAAITMSPLMQAIEKNDVNGARELIAKGADIKEKSKDCRWATHIGTFSIQCTPLMHAAEYGQNEIIRLLLDKGVDINEKVEGWTALQWAASSGEIESVKLLLDKDADISGALAEAVFEGKFDVVKLLIDKGADVNGKGRNWSGWSILDEAARMGHANIVKLLIEKGADADAAIARFEGLSLKNPNDGDYKAALYLVKKYSEKQESAPQQASASNLINAKKDLFISDIDRPTYKIPESANKFAIVVGIEKYLELPEASYAERDASVMRDHLVAMGFPMRNIILLTGQKATRTGISKNLETWLPNNINKNSTVFFYYSGHGAPDPSTGEAYIVPFDGDPNYLGETGYSLSKLYQKLGELKVKKVVIVLDSCFSGAGGRSVLAKGTRPLVMTSQSKSLSSNLIVLSATQGAQISTSSTSKGHGLLTYYYLKALNEGNIEIDDIYNYLKPKVEDEARSLNVNQSPSLQRGS
ncbi:MAG: ankyrin repeat domain-containing protein [Pseudomonadota bacterium]